MNVCGDEYTLPDMRKWFAVFLMLLLPLQWSIAVAADCCLRHAAPVQASHAGMTHEHHADTHHADHQSQAAPQQQDDAGKSAAAGCDMSCLGCHAHHCACAVFEKHSTLSLLPLIRHDTPYLSRLTSPLPDNLFRPPLAALA